MGKTTATTNTKKTNTKKTVCGHCGNKNLNLFQDNGLSPADNDYTVLCKAPVDPEDAWDKDDRELYGRDYRSESDIFKDGRIACNYQTCPNS